MQIANRVGFTIVELLIGVSAAAILAVAAGVLLESAFRGSARAKAAVEMEQDAAVAIHTIELAIRSASNTVTGEVGVDRLKVRTPSGAIRAFTVQTSNGRRSLVYNPNDPGGASMVLVDRRLGSFVSATTGKVVRVSMTLSGIDQNAQDIGLVLGYSNILVRMRN
jgi:type II secretory pathway pseudopilin PulG